MGPRRHAPVPDLWKKVCDVSTSQNLLFSVQLESLNGFSFEFDRFHLFFNRFFCICFHRIKDESLLSLGECVRATKWAKHEASFYKSKCLINHEHRWKCKLKSDNFKWVTRKRNSRADELNSFLQNSKSLQILQKIAPPD